MDPFKEANEIVRFNSALDLEALTIGAPPSTSYPSTAADGYQLPTGATRVLVSVKLDGGEPDTEIAMFAYMADIDEWFRVNGTTITATTDGITERFDCSGFDRVDVVETDTIAAAETFLEASYDPDA